MLTSWSSGPPAKDPRAPGQKAMRRRSADPLASRILASNGASKILVEIAVRPVRKRWRKCDGDACTCAACDGYGNKKRQQLSRRCLRYPIFWLACGGSSANRGDNITNVTRARRILTEWTVRASIGKGCNILWLRAA